METKLLLRDLGITGRQGISLYLSEFHPAKKKIKQNKITKILLSCFMVSLFDFVPFYIY